MDRGKLTNVPDLPRCSDPCPSTQSMLEANDQAGTRQVPVYGILDLGIRTIGNNTSGPEGF